jgi:hypothetical protein
MGRFSWQIAVGSMQFDFFQKINFQKKISKKKLVHLPTALCDLQTDLWKYLKLYHT